MDAPRRASEGSLPQEEDAAYWKNMYESLQQERTTQAEQQLLEFSEESEKREEALKSYIHHLETQVHELKESAQEAEELQNIVDNQTKQLEICKLLTGTTFSHVDSSSKQVSCVCTVLNPETKKSTKFRLVSSSSKTKMIKYEPIGKVDASLPHFLHSPIEFEACQGTGFLQHVLKSMFPDEE